MSDNRILYIHGFNSSARSEKANETKQYFSQHHPDIVLEVPQLKSSPDAAIAQLIDIVEAQKQANWHFMGSSLGGYFATFLAEKYHRPAVLINPSVRPFELLSKYLGQQTNPYTGEVYQVTQGFMQQLKQLEINEIADKSRYYLLVQTGDEVLDYAEAVAKYRGCKQEVQSGGDHRFVNYDRLLPDIVKFFQFA